MENSNFFSTDWKKLKADRKKESELSLEKDLEELRRRRNKDIEERNGLSDLTGAAIAQTVIFDLIYIQWLNEPFFWSKNGLFLLILNLAPFIAYLYSRHRKKQIDEWNKE